MSRHDTLVSAEAWDRLVADYRAAGGEETDDHILAELLRNAMIETEGE